MSRSDGTASTWKKEALRRSAGRLHGNRENYVSEATGHIVLSGDPDRLAAIAELFNGIEMDLSNDEVYAMFDAVDPGITALLKATNEGGRNLEWTARDPEVAERAAHEARWLESGERIWLDPQLTIEECFHSIHVEPVEGSADYSASVFSSGTHSIYLCTLLCAVFERMGATQASISTDYDDE